MEMLEARAITEADDPPDWWFRYVDDTHCKLKKQNSQQFTDHLNSLDPDIKFTTEEEVNGALAFLDTNTVRKEDGSLKVTIYRKPTHTDQYLNFSSNHPLEHKLGVIRTLHHRADTVITDPVDKEEEKDHINTALQACGYPPWAIAKALQPRDTIIPAQSTETNQKRGKYQHPVTIPYVKGVAEQFKRTLTSFGIKSHFKPYNTLRQQLMAPKDRTEKQDISGPIYHITCKGLHGVDCDSSYIGETERSLKARFAEHCRRSSTSSEVSKHIHKDCPGHTVNWDSVKVLDREPRYFERGVKEAIQIRLNKPDLNRDGVRYQLPHIWDSLLLKSHDL